MTSNVADKFLDCAVNARTAYGTNNSATAPVSSRAATGIAWRIGLTISLSHAIERAIRLFASLLACTLMLSCTCVYGADGIQQGKVVSAKQSEKSYGDELRLPDGSVIKTVWPAALCVTPVANRPWPNEPCSPPCEPLIYSLARVLPSGKELWAKSYIGRFKTSYEPCDSDKFGFTVRTRMFEFGNLMAGALLYFEPYDGTFFIGNPNSIQDHLHISTETGDAVGQVPSNMRVIGAYELRKMKEELRTEIERQYPILQTTDLKKFASRADYDTEANWRERLRYRAQFKRLEALIYKTPSSPKK